MQNVHAQDVEIKIRFIACIHGEPLQFQQQYKNAFGELFSISRFRFYTGKTALVFADSSRTMKPEPNYHLIDFADSSGTAFSIRVKPGRYKALQFQLGVDSADQIRGAQSGALDPVRGMYWTWNSGYISFKIEGVSPVSKQPAHLLAYHIGGYRSPYSTVWKMIAYPESIFELSPENKITIEIPVELGYFFDGSYPVHIAEISDCMTPGEEAARMSKNFIGAFQQPRIKINP